MDIMVNAEGKRVEVAASQGGFYANLAQGFGGNGDRYDGELQLHVGDDTVRFQLSDEQLVAVARTIDCYLQAVNGQDLWGHSPQAPSHDAEARYYAEQMAREPEALGPRCPDCGDLGVTAGHMGCQYPQDH